MENRSDISNWVRELNNVGTHEETLVILKEIFNMFNATDENPSITTLLTTIDNLTATENGDKFYYEHIYKTYFRLLYKMNQTTLSLEQKFQKLSNSLKNAYLNAIFSSEYYKIINVNLMFNLCYKYMNETSTSYTKYSISSLRLMTLFAKNFNSFLLPSHDLWKLIYLNLDAPFNNSREQCMALLDLIIKSDLNFTKVLFNELINFWSWTNKFKYYILTLIFNNYSFYSILNEYQNIEVEFFLSGIKISLKYKHLLPASQTLIKCLLKQNVFELNLVFMDIINASTQYEFSNFLNQWSIHLEDTHDLFQLLDLDTLEFNRRLISIRLIFQNEFEPDERLIRIDRFILDQIDNENYVSEYQHIFDIFVNKLHKNLNAENLENVMLILKTIYNLNQPSLRQNILKKMSILFDYLVKMNYQDPDQKQIIRNFIKFLKLNVFQLNDRGNYQALIFALKFYEILIKLFSNNIKLRINKNSNMHLNKKFYDEVFIHEWNLYSPVTYQEIYFLINNEYDDIRELALHLITNYYLNASIDLHFDFEADCLRALNSIDTSQNSNAHLYCCLHLNSKSNSDEFFILLENQLNVNFENFKLDPLWSIQNGQHLHGIIGCLNEIIKLNKGLNLTNISCLIKRINDISGFILDVLNLAGKNKLSAPDFETMDESLQKLVEQSKWQSNDDACNRKLLLQSIWLTLKACGDIATNTGIFILQNKLKFDKSETVEHLRNCLKINVTILYKCRHKGVIEAMGVSLGSLVKFITSNYKQSHDYYKILYDCFPILFGNVENTSNTRRGAGLSIMLHHLIKNDMQNDRPLLTYAIRILLGETKLQLTNSKCNGVAVNTENVDSLQASMLHYLCVLVKDSDLREDIMPYMERIIQMSFDQIKSDEWKIRNAALQLFGAIIPKLLGQRQQFEDENETAWEPVYISLDEIIIKMPNLNNYILTYFSSENHKSINSSLKSTSSIILFLEFLNKVEVRKVTGINQTDYIFKYNEILWNLLSHKCEKVRILSSKCLSLYHEFRLAIPITIENIIQILFKIPSARENFLFSLIKTIVFMVIKYQNDIHFIKNNFILTNFLNEVRTSIRLCYEQNSATFYAKNNFYSFYLRYHFLKLFLLLKYDQNENFIAAILFYDKDFNTAAINPDVMLNYYDKFNKFIGYDLWQKNVSTFYNL